MIEESIHNEIVNRLEKAEKEHDVKVLLAVESGSRAWGFESPNSDYDARFIYVNRPEWYLSVGLEEKRDVIEYPILDDFDINGWDLRKALRLYWKSNPGFVEWIQSPIIYKEHTDFLAQAAALLPSVYSIESGIYHYRSMAKNNFRTYLQSDLVRLKKYFYVLRPLLSVRWLETYKKPAPIEFSELLHLIDDHELRKEVEGLVQLKKITPELGLAPRELRIHEYIVRELARIELVSPDRFVRNDVEPDLSNLFRDVLYKSW